MNQQYGNMEYQRALANRSPVCNCCGYGRVREMRAWPKDGDPHFKGAVCPKCDVGECCI